MTEPKKIAIIDDDEAVRDSIDALLRAVGYATCLFKTGASFSDVCKAIEIDCVLLDVRLPDGDGIDLFQSLISRHFVKPVIIITGHGDVPMAVKAMRLGAWDFVQKPFDPDVLIETIAGALDAESARCKEESQAEEAQERLQRLTARESDVMKHLVIGRPNKIIASELGLSPRTVEIHRARVMEKTGAQSLSHLVRMAIAAGVNPDL